MWVCREREMQGFKVEEMKDGGYEEINMEIGKED